jgi:O-acetyl-ADP-ribose deacetylase (regulator of RNase III)
MEAACQRGEVQPGRIFPVQLGDTDRQVLNFSTKRHWRRPPRLADVEAGLDDLVRLLAELKIRSVAVPPLGCGNGGLDWAVVRPLIIKRLGALETDIRTWHSA